MPDRVQLPKLAFYRVTRRRPICQVAYTSWQSNEGAQMMPSERNPRCADELRID